MLVVALLSACIFLQRFELNLLIPSLFLVGHDRSENRWQNGGQH